MLRKTLRTFISSLLIVFTLAAANPAVAAAPPATNATITVYTAASLTAAFTEIGQKFERYNPGTHVVFNFAGSQLLSQQIVEGAPADVFASANKAQMDVAAGSGRMGVAQTFVYNRLIVIVPKGNPGQVTSLQDLGRPGLQIVLAAKAVPVGQYALDFLSRASKNKQFSETFQADVLANVVSYEDNVKAVFAKVALGEADAGIVYTTDASGADALKVTKLFISDDLNTVASYPIAYLKDSPQLFWSKGFVRFVLSNDGQRILSKYGFIRGVSTKK